MASQLDMLWEQESGFYVPGDAPSFGSIYSDMGAATQAASDWSSIITAGLGKVVDLEISRRYSPVDNQLPRQETGAYAGTRNVSSATMMPWLIGGGILLVAAVFLLKR